VRNAFRIAWREIRWEIFGDRGAALRLGIFALLPIILALSSRSPRGPNDLGILTLAIQSVLFPALSGVALIASTFTQEKENGTIIPLLASPVRDIDIVVGKLIGMLVPVLGVCIGSLALYYAIGSAEFGAERIANALPPTTMYALVVVALLYLLTAGSWVLIVAALVKTSRAGQQISGLLIGLSVAAFAGLGFAAANIAGGWALVGLGVVLVASDVVALEIARRVWRREEVLARL
jgi:ABC-type transport system involved in multi-copper enzyme maturation permease subunit